MNSIKTTNKPTFTLSCAQIERVSEINNIVIHDSTSKIGFFFIFDNNLVNKATRCREGFDWRYYGISNCVKRINPELKNPFLGFSVGSQKIQNYFEKLKMVMDFVENKIKLPKNQKLVLEESDIDYLVLFKPSLFWEHRVRNSLLTMLFRIAVHFEIPDNKSKKEIEVNFWEAAKKYNLIKDKPNILYSIEYFLKGNTKLMSETFTILGMAGWVNEFSNKANIEKFLLKQDNEKFLKTKSNKAN